MLSGQRYGVLGKCECQIGVYLAQQQSAMRCSGLQQANDVTCRDDSSVNIDVTVTITVTVTLSIGADFHRAMVASAPRKNNFS